MFEFLYLEVLYLLIIPFIFIFLVRKSRRLKAIFSKEVMKEIYIKKSGFSKRLRAYILIFSLIFGIISLARPVITNGEIKIKQSYINAVIALDISNSMRVDDLFPSRFEFAKNKIYSFLDNAMDKRLGVVGFSNEAFMISPLTSDFSSLKYLISNLNFSNLNLQGTDIYSLLRSVDTLFKDEKNKILVLFSDGGDNEEFSKEIKFAKENKISVFVYLTATNKGGLFKAPNNDVVLLKANQNIKDLALKTGGAYMQSSLNNDDMKALNSLISAKFKNSSDKDEVIKDQKELFYYPLILAIILYFMANFSLPVRRKA
ncbi:vWA domain-containing protein [Campylobacter ureolyticus]|uniref:vWA domain-containing protein n=1 Tax=Campylobacter ureolyticus TaxID=827 RepID=UPI0022B45B74|nr:VWA domain-containing protein [Campylobacter ureolyticus]MCZ6104846.1 VWA domain-containing protein [Campylobacter ureolyticus]MCZ6111168.1 VWA domain-containing protein [Campylobacter ureolyticus]MCZ6135038.1 VWA domain-containing protein [Campylobacter ureolyticus]MCZ6157462.1 VWA domain-containing protein [Campylobacter ureolyticus]MCZ6168983.1 VWA domain-containing protein [Campylobacter ureolyticus]